MQLRTFFDVVMGPEDAGESKPNPKMAILALERLQIPLSESLFIGDMIVDIETARNAGLPVWVIPTGSHDRITLQAAQPDQILQRMDEVLDLMKLR